MLEHEVSAEIGSRVYLKRENSGLRFNILNMLREPCNQLLLGKIFGRQKSLIEDGLS